jgi:hypothetical protein
MVVSTFDLCFIRISFRPEIWEIYLGAYWYLEGGPNLAEEFYGMHICSEIFQCDEVSYQMQALSAISHVTHPQVLTF